MNHALVSDLLLVLAGLFYAASTVAFAAVLLQPSPSRKGPRPGRFLMLLGVIFHAVQVLHYGLANRVCPMKTINLGVSFGALVAAGVYLGARKSLKIPALGVFVAPITLMVLLASRAVGVHEVPTEIRNGLLPVHISVNVLGDSFFVLASGTAAMYLVQEHMLKLKRGGWLFGRLPALDFLDQASHRFVLAGFLLITIGAVTGTLWVSRLEIGSSAEAVRIVLGYVTWGLFSGVLLLRSTLGWRGKRAAYGTLVGFAFAMVLVILYLLEAKVGAR